MPNYKISSIKIGNEIIDNVVLFHSLLPFTDGMVFVVDVNSRFFQDLKDFNSAKSLYLDDASMDTNKYGRALKSCLAVIDISFLSYENSNSARHNQNELSDFIDEVFQIVHYLL